MSNKKILARNSATISSSWAVVSGDVKLSHQFYYQIKTICNNSQY